MMTEREMILEETKRILARMPPPRKKKRRVVPGETGGVTAAADGPGPTAASAHRLSETLARIRGESPRPNAETATLMEAIRNRDGRPVAMGHEDLRAKMYGKLVTR